MPGTDMQPAPQFERLDSIQIMDSIVTSLSRRVRPKLDEEEAHAGSFPSPLPVESVSSLLTKPKSKLEIVSIVDIAATTWSDDDLHLLTMMRPFLDAQVAQEEEEEASLTQTITTAPSPITVVHPHHVVSDVSTRDTLRISPDFPGFTLPTPHFAPAHDGTFPQAVAFDDSSWGRVDGSRTEGRIQNNNRISSFLKSAMTGPPGSRKRARDADEIKQTVDSKPPAPLVTPVTDKATENDTRFHKNQCGNWHDKFAELKVFKASRGHCNIPNVWAENPSLALWVKRQRYQYKLKQEGKHSTMTEERQSALDALGFVWDAHAAAWDEKFHDLCVFRAERGHCNVPANWPENRQLAIWVKCQRRQYVLRTKNGKTEKMSDDRISLLQSIGFVFCPRGRSS